MRLYKTADGKPLNQFAFNGDYQNVAMTRTVIQNTHAAWAQLVQRKGQQATLE